MRMDNYYRVVTEDHICYMQCLKCHLLGPSKFAETHRGAAIKAGQAMRAICEAVETRIAERDNAAFAHGLRVGRRDEARRVLGMLHNHKLTRRQITERMRQEAQL